MDTIFPKFRLFPVNGGADIEYTGEVKTDAMTLFLKKDIYGSSLGLDGTGTVCKTVQQPCVATRRRKFTLD